MTGQGKSELDIFLENSEPVWRYSNTKINTKIYGYEYRFKVVYDFPLVATHITNSGQNMILYFVIFGKRWKREWLNVIRTDPFICRKVTVQAISSLSEQPEETVQCFSCVGRRLYVNEHLWEDTDPGKGRWPICQTLTILNVQGVHVFTWMPIRL